MRKLALALGLLVWMGWFGPSVPPTAASAGSGSKVVIVVGATQGTTSSYRSDGDQAAAEFAKYTSNIVKVYSPNATWENVAAAASGATVLVYIGHGTGYPNPYVSYLQPRGDDGMGLNYSSGRYAKSDSYTQYYGENYMATLNLAPNAVVILWHLCYASGDNEWGTGLPSLSTAKTRVDSYAAGFLRGNARAVIAEGLGSINPYIDGIFTKSGTIDQVWRSAPNFHNNVMSWTSSRNAGYTSSIDPDYQHPQSDGDYYYRSLVSQPGMTTAAVGIPSTPPTPPTPTDFTPLPATRILDTTHNVGISGKLTSGHHQTFTVTGRGGVPANATAVTGNLTVVNQSDRGFLYVGPLATDQPPSSSLNFPGGDIRANGVTVALDSGGHLSVIFISTDVGTYTTDVYFDVTGYFTPELAKGALYTAITPIRVLDTRHGTGLSAALQAGHHQTFSLAGVPAGAVAITGNLTVTNQSAPGYFYLGPDATDSSPYGTLDFPTGDNRANGVTVGLDSQGKLSVVYIAGSGAHSDVILDVTGYFKPGSSGSVFEPVTPARILDTRWGISLVNQFSASQAQTFTVVGKGFVPANATAITGNVTVTNQKYKGFVYVGPVATNSPPTSTLNFPTGDNRANGMTVQLGPNGTLSVTYISTRNGSYKTDVIYDVTGYYVPVGS